MADTEQQVSSQEATQTEAPEQQQEAVAELSIEDRARALRWVPKEEFKGDPAKWVPAETFVDRQPFFEKIDQLKTSLKHVQTEQEREKERNRKFMAEYQAAAMKAAEAQFNEKLAVLREEKKLALREGETDRVVDLDEQMADLREQKKQAAYVEMPERIIPDPAEQRAKVQAFVERNKWYDTDEDMRDWADMRGRRLASQGIHGDEILSRLEKDVKEAFPQKFRNSNRDKPSAVEGSSAAGSISKSVPSDMSTLEREIMKNIISVTPGMTEAQYIKEFKKAGGR